MSDRPCVCLTGPVVLHEGHCCFRGPNPTCHEPEIAALRRPGYVPEPIAGQLDLLDAMCPPEPTCPAPCLPPDPKETDR